MASDFGWVDFAGENQSKMLDVVKLFREKDTRDELGIGTIRDAFSDYFFPGTSTIQTRARYMLFVPWVYTMLEEKKVRYPKIIDRARKEEIKLVYALLKSDDTDGIIGSDAKDKLQRLPSAIYWTGMEQWGIRLFPGSRDQYHRSLRKDYYRSNERNWDPGLPEPPENIMDYTELRLRREDAEYLVDRISCSQNGTLLYFLVNEGEGIEADYFWQLPIVKNLPDTLQNNIQHARNFTETIYGANLLYNYLLSIQVENKEWVEKYKEILESWFNLISARRVELMGWYENLHDFWTSEALTRGRIPGSTRTFVEQWYEILFNKEKLSNILNSREAEELIKNREWKLKRDRARLWNARAREMWGGASGTTPLDYRWSTVEIIISDILEGLEKEGGKVA
ncbi:MAG: DUF6361 family protein [Bacillota bacterium]